MCLGLLKYECISKLFFCSPLGNIRVYCRVRPFLPGQLSGMSTVGHVDDGGITIITPPKYGKEGRRSFNFNKVFGPSATQGCLTSQLTDTCYLSIYQTIHQLIFFWPCCRGSVCRYTTSNSVSTRWLQCVHLCLWPDRIRQNFHNGKHIYDDFLRL